MKVTFFTPLNLLWARRPGDDSHASTIHKAYAREMWRERGAFARAALFTWLVLGWPLATLAQALWLTAWNGPAIRRRSGKGIARQLAEQCVLSVEPGVPPPWYYILDLYDDAKRARAGAYLQTYQSKGIYSFLRQRMRGGSARELFDKRRFAENCREQGLAHASVVLAAWSGRLHWEGEAERLPRAPLFLKPMLGKGGHGCEAWELDASDGEPRWADAKGRSCSEDELLDRVRRRSRLRRLVLQVRLRNHSEIAELAGDALATVRVLSILDERGRYEPAAAALRMAVPADAIVDNFHNRGIAALVEMSTGELGPARGGGLRGVGVFANDDWCDTHPRTGALIRGRKLPFWGETVALVRDAHAALPGTAAAGWDVAITPEGPVLCEGNAKPALDIFQRLGGEPLGDARFGALLAHHVRSALADEPPFDAAQARELQRALRSSGSRVQAGPGLRP